MWKVIALLFVATAAGAQPTQLTCGPGAATCGPAIVLGAGTGAPVIVPVGGAADVNCPATVPTAGGTNTTVNTLNAVVTCATPARTTTVQSVSFYAATGIVGAKIRCSVYTFPAGYVAGTTSVPKVATGCDTVEWSAPAANVNAFVTLATTGACPLAASTRYQIACNGDNAAGGGFFLGYNTTNCTVGGVQCNQQVNPETYTGTPLPNPWTANNQAPDAFSFYMTVQ
jgi:hypothetical protein